MRCPKPYAEPDRTGEKANASGLLRSKTVAPDPKSEIFYTAVFMPSCRKKKNPQNAEHRCDAMNRENHSNAREEIGRY